MNFRKQFVVKPGTKVKLKDYDPEETLGIKKNTKEHKQLEKELDRLDDLQYLMYAQKQHALLVIFQALDAGGKDGTIRHVMSGFNPQGCEVSSFKEPTEEELAHDYLWRVHQKVPAVGYVGIFNRSHYEDVLVVRVHDLVPKEVWSKRYAQIDSFEKMLAENRVTIAKFYLHISKDEQKQRFDARIDDPNKRWKISADDFKERKYWDEYTKAYEEALTQCNSDQAPWYIVPANKKWFRNLAVSQILVETLEDLKMSFPPATIDVKKLKWK
jgi:PPK2 family polyphosphate:nucleotide phosphotransferase